MRENSPSRTAIGVAMHRAAHQALDQPPVFSDPFADRIIGPRARAVLAEHPRRFERSWHASFLRAILAARSRVAEDTLADAIARGVRQYVILGAGLDTFALRNIDPSLRVFEVDHPQTQAWKRRLLETEGLAIPANLVFVPVDFERQQLDAELRAAGLDPAAPTYFSWLGVTPYLHRDAIDTTLRTIARFAGPTGGVVFDFFKRPARKEWMSRMALWLRSRYVARLGEPFRSFIDPAEIEAELHRVGFVRVDILSPEMLNTTYFHGRDRLRVSPVTYIARAQSVVESGPVTVSPVHHSAKAS